MPSILQTWMHRLAARATAEARRIAARVALGVGLCILAVIGLVITLAYLAGAVWQALVPLLGPKGADLVLAGTWLVISIVAGSVGYRILQHPRGPR